jgi:hypothetical protein
MKIRGSFTSGSAAAAARFRGRYWLPRRTQHAGYVHQRRRAHLRAELSVLPPRGNLRADVAGDLQRRASLGRSIKERVARRDMPPWHLDKTVGIRQYKNDISLTDEEIATIVKWVDAARRRAIPPICPSRSRSRPKTPGTSAARSDWPPPTNSPCIQRARTGGSISIRQSL